MNQLMEYLRSILCSGTNKELVELRSRVKELEALLEPPPAPTIKGRIGADVIERLYADIFPKQRNAIYISDSVFEITTISELRRFVAWDNVNIFKYVPEYHDCDDFAMALAGDFAKYPGWSGFPVSFLWGSYYGGHAFCTTVAWPSFTDRTPTVYFIEPQNDWEIARESVQGTDLWLLPMSKSSPVIASDAK
jgi:hypothetical protein